MKVSKERGEQLAVEYGIKFMETSAKASVNVEEAFHTLARDIKTKTEKFNIRPSSRHLFKYHIWVIYMKWCSDPDQNKLAFNYYAKPHSTSILS